MAITNIFTNGSFRFKIIILKKSAVGQPIKKANLDQIPDFFVLGIDDEKGLTTKVPRRGEKPVQLKRKAGDGQ